MAAAGVAELAALVDRIRLTVEDQQVRIEGLTLASGSAAAAIVNLTAAHGGDSRSGEAKLNFAAAKGLDPSTWSGREDKKVSFKEWRSEVVNWACALHDEAQEVLREVSDVRQGQPIIVADIIAGSDAMNTMLDKAIYSMLFKATTGTARNVVHNAGQSKGFAAYNALVHYGAPRSTTDKQLAMGGVLNPKRSANEGKLQLDLQKWLSEIVEFEARFGDINDDLKMYGLKNLIPEDTFNNRMLGVQYATFNDLLCHVKNIVADRTLTAVKEASGRSPTGAQKEDPMDIGQLTGQITEQILVAIDKKGGWKGKGKGSEREGGRGERGPYDPQKKGNGKGEKGKGKGKGAGAASGAASGGKQCFKCKGWGHLKAQCPSKNDAGWGINDVGQDEEAAGEDETKKEEQDDQPDWEDGQWDGEMFMLDYSGTPPPTHEIPVHNMFQCLECEDAGVMAVTNPAEGHWAKVTAAMDSGAVDHVFPENVLTGIPLEPSPLSKAGKGYVSATSEEIPNRGQRKLKMKTMEGQTRGMIVQVAPVRKPLLSAAKMNEAGNDVNLAGKDPHIKNIKTGEITKLRRCGRTYLLDMWVWVAPEKSSTSGFTRR